MSIADLPTQPTSKDVDLRYRGVKLSQRGDPVWELALSYPRQGDWTEAEYLRLTETEFVELVDGCLEFLPMATFFHQRIALWLRDQLVAFFRKTKSRAEASVAPCSVQLGPLNVRQPDVFVVMPERVIDPMLPPEGADLVMEIVSPGVESRQRDLVDKRRDYAQAGVSEYWIVDPEADLVTVLALNGTEYRVHGEFKPGETASSVLLPGLTVDVSAVFAAGRGEG